MDQGFTTKLKTELQKIFWGLKFMTLSVCLLSKKSLSRTLWGGSLFKSNSLQVSGAFSHCVEKQIYLANYEGNS